jgi:hypothetical protein
MYIPNEFMGQMSVVAAHAAGPDNIPMIKEAPEKD